MKPTKAFLLSIILYSSVVFSQSTNDLLWYNTEPDAWIESLPVGNGRLGAMVYGKVNQETIALNEVTLWCGEADPNQNKQGGKQKLDEAYNLFFNNKIGEAHSFIKSNFMNKPESFGTHLPFGDLKLDFRHDKSKTSEYIRKLDMKNSTVSVSYKIKDTTFNRLYFVSNPNNLMYVKIWSDKQKGISLDASLDMILNNTIIAENNKLIVSGDTKFKKEKASVLYNSIIDFETSNGNLTTSENKISITKADTLFIRIAINTNFKNNSNPKEVCINQLSNKETFSQALNKHIEDVSSLYKRVDFNMSSSNKKIQKPINERIDDMVKGCPDPELITRYFNYGRYLLIAGSRENSPLPMNLQGIWNDNRACNMPWTNDYHLDINIQQNYWPTEVCNLSESHVPLFNFIDSLVVPGSASASEVFGCRGWIANAMVNAWGCTTPNWGFWGFFPEGSTWISSHLWEHFLFTRDTDFLKNKAYPILKSNAEFFIDYMKVHPENGYLLGISTSPENAYLYNNKKGYAKRGYASLGPTSQIVLVDMLFNSCIEASKILGIDSKFRDSLITYKKQLPPLKIGKDGTIQEWFEDYDEADPNHRHTSHLISLYPGNKITPDDVDLAEAAQKIIDKKLNSSNFEDVEWVRGNMINYEARLLKGNSAYKHLMALLDKHCSSSMLSYSAAGVASAKEEIFIIDGTTSGVAGVAEMLIQSHNNAVNLLPALPTVWPDGSISGLCARGGFEVDIEWKKGKLLGGAIFSKNGEDCVLKYNNDKIVFPTKKGQNYSFVYNSGKLKIKER